MQRCWDSRIKIIQQLIVACDGLEHRKSQVFFKIFEVMKTLEGLTLFQDDKLIAKGRIPSWFGGK
jgi:hypothetical protein